GDGARHQPGLDELHVLPAGPSSRQPDAGQPAARSGPVGRALLRAGQPGLHSGLRPMTARPPAAAAPQRPAPEPLMPVDLSDPADPATQLYLAEIDIERGRPLGVAVALLRVAVALLRALAIWLRAVVVTARPRQWPKNLLVLAAPLAG